MINKAESHRITRRDLLQTTAGGVALAITSRLLAAEAETASGPKIDRKIKAGLVGCGGRGSWIAGLFKEHGGYDFVAVGDYSQQAADQCGDALGVGQGRRFSGLSAYKKVMDTGIEAIVLETPPFFFPEHVEAAVKAGLHVYMAKPVAVDVPGTLKIGQVGRQSIRNKRCFLVDYQMPTDPLNVEVAKRISEGGIGQIKMVNTVGMAGGGFSDPPLTATIESRLRDLIWVNDIALGGDYVVNYDIHAIDAALWILGRRPVAAMGAAAVCRPDPHGDARDSCMVVFEMSDGLVWGHDSAAGTNHRARSLQCVIQGSQASAEINYWGKAFLRGGPMHYGGGDVENLYEAGAKRNIATFYQNVIEGRFEHPSVNRSVDCTLSCILAREAAARHGRLTMDDLIKEDKKLEVNLNGLKA
ncbi:MAG: Gfo/Idh/MocA family oxidoreductase [Planctomycetota bacterium]|nr:Gfo/Idh/MocA family oxidoreductase [Planctomycetota bacterium]